MGEPRWFERAADILEKELADGKITDEEFRKELRELRRELVESERRE